MKNIVILLFISFCMPNTLLAQQTEKNTFTYKVGLLEVTLLAESQGQGNKGILVDATPEMLSEYAPEGTFPNAMNAFLIKTPDKNILVDAGLGRKLFDNLKSVGVSADQIDVVLITHMHGDHIGGMIQNDKVMFPKADVYLPQPEHDYWMSIDAKQQQNVIAAYKEQLHLFQPGELGTTVSELLPGIQPIAAYGHTPGHSMYLVSSGKDKLLIWGDLSHAMAIQMPYPQVSVTYDVDPKLAATSRKQVLEYVSENNIPVAGMHIAYPSIGVIQSNTKGGYRFIPADN